MSCRTIIISIFVCTSFDCWKDNEKRKLRNGIRVRNDFPWDMQRAVRRQTDIRGHGSVGTVSTGVLTGSAFQLLGVVVAGVAWSPGRVHLRTVPLGIYIYIFNVFRSNETFSRYKKSLQNFHFRKIIVRNLNEFVFFSLCRGDFEKYFYF